MVHSTKQKSLFYEVQTKIPIYLICYEIDHRSIPFYLLGVLTTSQF
jgi:hypothetical protein